MENIINNISKKILNVKDYTFVQEHNSLLKLSDKILIYCLGNQWKIIPLQVALSYPIIYDKFVDDENYDVTIVLCPITLRSIALKGIFRLKTYVDTTAQGNNSGNPIVQSANSGNRITMVLEDNDSNLLPIDLGFKIDKKYVIRSNKRVDVKIMTVRTAITSFSSDSLYLKVNADIKLEPIFDSAYYSNNIDHMNGTLDEGLIHPKTLVYIIQYRDAHSTNAKEKISIILGKDSDKNNVSGYDLKKSNLINYLYKYQSKIINKSGYIMPMLWYTAKEIYPHAKVVYIPA
jgi:hypothetical protein